MHFNEVGISWRVNVNACEEMHVLDVGDIGVMKCRFQFKDS
jgi:hypothetical protein